MKRLFITLVAMLLIASPCIAGDVASLINFGFSPDSSYFMFGQYGIDEKSGTPYAELYFVDTKRNDFVAQGQARASYPAVLEPGQDPIGALFALYGEHAVQAKKYKINHLKQGRIVYLLLNGAPYTDALSFRDFKTDSLYDVKLSQAVVESGGNASSSFSISVVINEKSGSVKRFEAGNPGIKRAGVSGYAIRQILVAPDERMLVFIVEKKMATDKGAGLRYMVETVRIP